MALAQLMKGTRQKSLARAPLPLHEHADVCGSHRLDHAEESAHGQTRSEYLPQLLEIAGHNLNVLFEKLDAQLNRANGHARARAHIGLSNPGLIKEGPVGRPKVAQEVTVGVSDNFAMLPRDRIHRQYQVVGLCMPNANHVAHEGDLTACLRLCEHHQLALGQPNALQR